jgi:hypothetical protein
MPDVLDTFTEICKNHFPKRGSSLRPLESLDSLF